MNRRRRITRQFARVAASLAVIAAVLAAESTPALAADAWTSGWDSRALGVDPARPSWSRGPISVSLVSGNLAVAIPGPVFPTPTGGSLGVTAYLNSAPAQPAPTCSPTPCTPPLNYSASSRNSELGAGITLGAGDPGSAHPVMLIDYSQLYGSDPMFAVVEVVFESGGSAFYGRVGASDDFVPVDADGLQATDGSMVSRNPSGDSTAGNPAWTFTEADGLVARFGVADATSGRALMVGLERQATLSGTSEGLTYTYGSTAHPRLLTRISDSTGRELLLKWNAVDAGACPDAILCLTGPDNQTWKYIAEGAGGTSGNLERVFDGTRDVLKLRWTGGKVDRVWNADDLDPSNASPGYNGAHGLELTYRTCCTFTGAVEKVIDRNVTSEGAATSATWTFTYRSCRTSGAGTCGPYDPPESQTAHAGTPAGGARQMGNFAQIRYPRMGFDLYWMDLAGHLAVQQDPNWKHYWQYDGAGRLLWEENNAGNPFDNTYDGATKLLISGQQPDPDGGGPRGRPTTSYRYDEAAIGTTASAGPAMTGLQAAYYTNEHLAGVPAKRQNDRGTGGVVDYDWTSSGPSALGGRQTDYSVRWSGVLKVPTAGSYAFNLAGDDGLRLIVDDDLLIDEWTTGSNDASASKTLSAGDHRVVVEYFQHTGPASVHLSWTPPGGSAVIVDDSDTRPGYGLQTSAVSPEGQIGFSHFADPVLGKPDYTLEGGAGLRLVTSYAYDERGRMSAKHMPKGNKDRAISSDGDLQGSPAAGYSTSYAYYADTESAGPPAACASGTSVNQGGQLKTVSVEGLATRSLVHDAAGRQLAETKGSGTYCWSYTAEGRLSAERAPGEGAVSSCSDPQATRCFTYDPAGLMRSATNADSALTFEYDEAARMTRATTREGGSVISESAQVYDTEDHVTKKTFAAGALTSSPQYHTLYNWDSHDRLASLRNPVTPSGNHYYFHYGDQNRLDNIELVGQGWIAHTALLYNPTGWLMGVHNRHGSNCGAGGNCTWPTDNNPFTDYDYQRDQDGRLTEETRIAGGEPNVTNSYAYDSAGRLDTWTKPDGAVRDYSYDEDSNRTQITDTPAEGSSTSVQSLTYDRALTPGVDQLTSLATPAGTTSYSYDSDGRATGRGTDLLTWNGYNTIAGGTFATNQVAYTYDALGRLLKRTTTSPLSTSRYAYIGNDEQPVADLTAANAIQTFYVNDAEGHPLETLTGPPTDANTRVHRLYNGHGDLTATVDKNGQRTALNTYGPFGDVNPAMSTTGGLADRYTGQWHKKLDPATSLTLMGARPYDTNLGRFLSTDPVDGGSANNYDYALQDPLNTYDLDGRCVFGLPCPWHGMGEEIVRGVRKTIKAINAPERIRWAIECGRALGGAKLFPGACDPLEFYLGPVEPAYGGKKKKRKRRA